MNNSSVSSKDSRLIKTPDIFCLVRGSAEGATPLNAFDSALLNAGVGDTNLIRVSSILPPKISQFEVKNIELPKGVMLPIAYASISSKNPKQIISSAVAVGIPKDDLQAGVIMECSDHGTLDSVEATARQMVTDAFNFRNRELKEIRSLGIEHEVDSCGATFAGVALWYA